MIHVSFFLCQITNLTKWKEYEKQLDDWHNEKKRQSVEFTITENDLDADMRLPDLEVKGLVSHLSQLFFCLSFSFSPIIFFDFLTVSLLFLCLSLSLCISVFISDLSVNITIPIDFSITFLCI